MCNTKATTAQATQAATTALQILCATCNAVINVKRRAPHTRFCSDRCRIKAHRLALACAQRTDNLSATALHAVLVAGRKPLRRAAQLARIPLKTALQDIRTQLAADIETSNDAVLVGIDGMTTHVR